MKRKTSEELENSPEVKQCRLPLTVINNSANFNSFNIPSPARGDRTPRPSMDAVGEAEMELRRVMDNFVNIYEQLGKCNGPNMKPNYSYTELAYLAMLRSPNFCLPITEIYSYIQSRFAFFKNSTRKHWKNAVRHSLAKTLCFTKIPVGRGTSASENLSRSTYLWCIIPSSIASFARGDYRPSADRESGTNTLRWGYYRVNAGQFWDQVGNFLSTKMLTFKKELESSHDPGHILESQVCKLSESFPVSEDSKPLTSSPVSRSITPDRKTINDVTMKTETIVHSLKSPPAYCPKQLQNVTPYKTAQAPPNRQFQNLGFLNQSPNSSFCDSMRRTPMYNSFDFRDSGNESLECESSPDQKRVLSSCRLPQYNSSSPALDLTTAHCAASQVETDLSVIDISPFDVPELPDLSYIVSSSPEFNNPQQSHSFNDSGYAIDYSLNYSSDSSQFLNRSNDSCQYTNNMQYHAPHSPMAAPQFHSFPRSHVAAGTLGIRQNYGNYLITNSDPMISNFSTPNWNCL